LQFWSDSQDRLAFAICLLAIPGGVWLGSRLHGALDQRQIYRACYVLLVVIALKLKEARCCPE
jgi:hypothetical protein